MSIKFDNAFLTKGGNVGMQFIETKTKEVWSVYTNNKGNIVVSDLI